MQNIYVKLYNLCKKYDNGTSFNNYSLKDYNGRLFRQVNDLLEFNEIYKAFKRSKIKKIIRSEFGRIIKNHFLGIAGAWDLQIVKTKQGIFKGVILTAILKNTLFIFKAGCFGTEKNKDLTGKKAFAWFKKYLREDNIDIEDYAITTGEEVKKEIESPIIENYILFKKITGVNHLDYNSAWASQVVKKYPELKNAFSKLYHIKHKEYPSIVLGYMQSEYCNYKWTHFSKEGINKTNEIIKDTIKKLFRNGFEIIGVNTDGIWYRDITGKNRLYHDNNEGVDFGQWKNDHINCEFLSYSDGQYWFRENGIFFPKARGFYIYDFIKPRSEWDEYDFDKAVSSLANLIWDSENGFIFNFDVKKIKEGKI